MGSVALFLGFFIAHSTGYVRAHLERNQCLNYHNIAFEEWESHTGNCEAFDQLYFARTCLYQSKGDSAM